MVFPRSTTRIALTALPAVSLTATQGYQLASLAAGTQSIEEEIIIVVSRRPCPDLARAGAKLEALLANAPPRTRAEAYNAFVKELGAARPGRAVKKFRFEHKGK